MRNPHANNKRKETEELANTGLAVREIGIETMWATLRGTKKKTSRVQRRKDEAWRKREARRRRSGHGYRRGHTGGSVPGETNARVGDRWARGRGEAGQGRRNSKKEDESMRRQENAQPTAFPCPPDSLKYAKQQTEGNRRAGKHGLAVCEIGIETM
jgi:hypothetical protein